MGLFRSALIAVAIVLGAAPSRAASGPVIGLSERTVDFGTVPQQQLLHKDLIIRNEGDAPLIIFKIEPSCGCTGVMMADSIVAPGGQLRIDVSFSTRDYQGPQEKQIQILSNDPAERLVKVAVKADVVPVIEISTDRVRFGPVRRGETPEQTVRLAAKPGFGLGVKEIKGGQNWLTSSFSVDKTATEEVCVVRLKLKPDAPTGPFRLPVDVYTTGATPQTVKLEVTGQVISYFQLDGDPRVNFSITEKGVTSVVYVKFLCDGTKPYRLESVESTVAFVTGEIEPDGPGAFRAKLTLSGLAPAGSFRGIVKIHTTDPAQPTIEVIVQGLVRG